MSNLAINDAGEVLAFDGKEWKPAPVAQNDKGDRMAFDGKEWRSLSDGKKAAKPTVAGNAIDALNTGVNWAGTQFTKGITGILGGADTLGELGKRGAAYIGEKVGAPDVGKNIGAAFKSQVTFGGLAPSTEGMNRAVFQGMGVPEVNAGDNPALTLKPPMLDGREINVGKMLDVGAQAIPGMMMLPAGPASAALSPTARAATTAVPAMAGGMASEAAGQATSGTPWEIPARIAGGVFGSLAGGRIVSPLPAKLTPEQARSVQTAKDAGVPLTVGQETGRGRWLESALARFPTSQGRMASFADDQATAVNRTALKQAGAEGDRLDPTTMNRVIDKASSEFEAAKQTSGNIKLDTEFFKKLEDTVASYLDNTPAAAQTPAVGKRAADFLASEGRELTGAQYQEFRRTLNTAAQSVTDVGAKRALQGMRNALDDAMEASLPAEQAKAWQEVRKNWANLKILTKAASGGTVDSRSAGNLSPSALSMALRQRQGADRFASTEGGLNDVARMAGYLADTIPNSGTPQTMATQAAITGAPVVAGFAAGNLPGALTAGGAMLAPNVIARAMTGTGGGGLLRDYLVNQAMPTARAQIPQGLRGVPFSLAPGVVVAAPRLENRQ